MKKLALTLSTISLFALSACQFGYVKTDYATMKSDMDKVTVSYKKATAQGKSETVTVKDGKKTTDGAASKKYDYEWDGEAWIVPTSRETESDETMILSAINATLKGTLEKSTEEDLKDATLYKGINRYRVVQKTETPHEGYVSITEAQMDYNGEGLVTRAFVKMTQKTDGKNYSYFSITITASYSK